MPDIFSRISRTDVAKANLGQQEELVDGFKKAGNPLVSGTVSDRAIKFVSLVISNEPFLRYCQLPQATLPTLHDAIVAIENQNKMAQLDGITSRSERSIINDTAKQMVAAANHIGAECLEREKKHTMATAKWGKVPEYGFYLAALGVSIGGGIIATSAATSAFAGVAIALSAGALAIGLAYVGTKFRDLTQRILTTWRDSRGNDINPPTLPLELVRLDDEDRSSD